MAKISELDLKAMLMSERNDAMSAMMASKLSDERATALDYYQGDMSRVLPTAPGRSKAVSTDTSDTIEGLMPVLMDIFSGGDEFVRFEPHGPEDVQAADQETDYINHVFHQQNDGFLILYTFIKDALLSKVGIVKVWWEEKEETERETYYDQPEEAVAAISAADDVDIVERSEHDGLYDITVESKRDSSCARVECVPPEEFGISRHARSLRECDYCFQDIAKSQDTLIAQGFDEEEVKKLPSYLAASTAEELSRDTVDESTLRSGDNLNEASRIVLITEHYIKMDYEGDGKARFYRVTTGANGELLKRDGKEDVFEVDRLPFAAMTPIIMPHRFWGRSVADLVKDIQDQKTALTRGMLDSLYFTINPRTLVNTALSTNETLDDLLVARPMGIIRHKGEGAIEFVQTPDVTQSIYPALQYLDATREWRTGVSRQGQGVDPNALQNQVATIANQMLNASQAKVKLIARIFAETGIKDLFMLLHATVRKHATQPAIVRLRNQWAQVDPRDWKTRNDMTVNVGLGTGSKPEQLAHQQLVITAQMQAVPLGLVTPKNFFESAKELIRLGGHKDVDRFFTAPNPQTQDQPVPQAPDPKQAEIAAKAQQEQAKIQADAAHQKMKTEADLQFQGAKMQMDAHQAQLKHNLDESLAITKAQLDERVAVHNMAMKERELQLKTQGEQHKAQLDAQSAEHKAHLDAQSGERSHKLAVAKVNAKSENGTKIKEDGSIEMHPELIGALKALADGHEKLMQAVTAPRKTHVHRDPKTGRVSHATSELAK